MFRTPLLLCFLVVSSLDGGIVITREGTVGDTFTNPLGCAAKCPSTSTAATTLSCTCKCPNKNTWMQDTEDCVQESSCPYSFRSDRILAVTIPSRKVDDKLAPGQGLLYQGAKAPKTTGGYLITKFEYLKGNSWTNPSQKEQNYFYFQSQGQSQGQKYILWERIQLQDISSYAGAIIRFTLRPTDNVAPEGCLEIKIAGSLTYIAPTLETRVPAVTTSTSSIEKTTSYSSSTFYSDGPTSQEEMISNDPTTGYEDVTPSGVDVDDETTDSTGNEPPSSTKTISSDLPTLPPIVLEQKDSSDSSAGAIAGGIIGGIFIAALVVALIVFLWRRRSGKFVTESDTVNLPNPVYSGKVAGSEAVNLHNPAYSGKVKGEAPETAVYERPDETGQRRADDVIYEEISQGPPKANGCSSNGACKEPVQVPNEEGPYEEPVKVPKEEGPCEEPVKVLDEGPYEEPVSNAKNAE
ncbi:uncharacterized protein [Oscarella lobularis]|uniref:uncharacterized protein n=1 Tax=Oscarella lobularis TaxID=121494 RepID=UPI0033143293